jgi:hypothetical protein
MAIFNSYVKLSEGILFNWIDLKHFVLVNFSPLEDFSNTGASTCWLSRWEVNPPKNTKLTMWLSMVIYSNPEIPSEMGHGKL